jgi:uncharacterized protein (TIGR02421 family)
MPSQSPKPGPLVAAEVIAQLGKDKRVRMALPGGGRLQLDRRLPFLCVYRRPANADPGTEELVTSEMAYVVIPAEPRPARQSLHFLHSIVEQLSKHFGAFLLVEIWSSPLSDRHEPAASANGSATNVTPRFEVVAPTARIPRRTVEALSKSLGKNSLPLGSARVTLAPPERLAPHGMKPLVRIRELKEWNCYFLGVKVRPVYRNATSQELFPVELRAIRRSVNNAFKQAFFAFTRQRTALRLAHYQALGGRSVVKAVLDIDRQLADIGRSFDLLLQATPINAESAWREFRRSRFEKPPVFYYRPLSHDPTLLKRQLYLIPVERIDDPTLSYLFRQKQEELDRQITLLSDVDTPRFLPESLQIYGGVSNALLQQAKELLDRVPTRSREESGDSQLTATDFAKRAQQELGYYQQQCADFAGTVAVREDIYSGMMCSGNQLLIGGKTRIPKRRVEALLQHEIGTHLVTRYNGHVQPFQQLEVGLAGYDGMQEGLAVLAEYLVGGLSRFRMRVLAARVVAAQQLLDGATFIETFRTLDRNYEFSQRTAYTVTMRIYRGGGLTKDAVYLRGLVQILKYVRDGGELEPLFVGKVASAHLPLLAELSLRQILKPPALRPRYLENPKTLKKIEGLRSGMSVLELLHLGRE